LAVYSKLFQHLAFFFGWDAPSTQVAYQLRDKPFAHRAKLKDTAYVSKNSNT
jgi:hypothetical protein